MTRFVFHMFAELLGSNVLEGNFIRAKENQNATRIWQTCYPNILLLFKMNIDKRAYIRIIELGKCHSRNSIPPALLLPGAIDQIIERQCL